MRKKALIITSILATLLFMDTSLVTFAQQKAPVKPAAKVQPKATTPAATMQAIPPVITASRELPGIDQFSIMNPTFSKDGKYLAAFFNGEKIIKIYDTKTGTEVANLGQDLLYGSKFVDGMAFTGPDSSKLIVMRAEAPLKIIDWKNKKVDSELDLGVTGYKITDFAFTPNQQMLVVAKQNGIDVWDFTQCKKTKSLLEGEKINAVDISNDGNIVVFAKSGQPADSVGMIDLKTLEVSKKPLANVSAEDKSKLPAYEVQSVEFSGGNNVIAGYLNLPAGTFKPDGPAGIYLIHPQKNSFSGPLALSDYRLSVAKYVAPFNGILTSAFNFKDDNSTTSALDFVDPKTMKILKTYNHSEFKAPMLAVNVSPDGSMMAAALKGPEGVKLHLFTLSKPQPVK